MPPQKKKGPPGKFGYWPGGKPRNKPRKRRPGPSPARPGPKKRPGPSDPRPGPRRPPVRTPRPKGNESEGPRPRPRPAPKPKPKPKPTPDGPPGGPFSKDKESAYKRFNSFLRIIGVDIGPGIELIIRRAVVDGITPDQIELIMPDIQDTASWRKRFPGWHQRTANGFNQITVSEYLDLEDAYQRIMKEAGLPKGFFDTPSDFGNWIGKNVSVAEIQDRVAIATDSVRKVDPTARDLLGKFYGVTSGDLASYFLDQGRALPTLQRQYAAVNVAQWAVKNGLSVGGSNRYEDLVDKGVTPERAAEGYGTIAAFTNTLGQLGDVYGERYNQTDAENDVFFNQTEKRRRIASKEMGTFSGSSRGATGIADRGTSY